MELRVKSMIFKRLLFFSDPRSVIKFHLLALTLLFLVVNGILFWKIGIMVDYDTEGYFLYASEIKERGWFFKPHLFWYSGYALFIVLMTSIYDSQVSVVLGQYVLSYLAMLSLYFSGWKLFQNPWAGFITCIWFIGFFMIQFWNLFLYAESLFISLNCFVLLFLVFWIRDNKNKLIFTFLSLFILVAFLTKPTGISLIAGLMGILAWHFWEKINSIKSKSLFVITVSIILLLLINQMLSTFTFIRDYQIGEVVYNVHKLADQPFAKWLMIDVPEDLYLPSEELPPIIQLGLIVFLNPWYSIKLINTKLFFFIFYIRPYYSWGHNLLALSVLLPMYWAFIVEWRSKKIDVFLRIFVLIFISVSILSPILLTINWNSRFLMPLLPVVFLLGGNGILLAILKSKYVQY